MVAQKPIRIAHVIGKMMSGGVESAVMNYYRHIDRAKVQFDFIIDEDSTIVPYDEIESLGGKVYKIPPYQKPLAYHRALVRLLREKKYRIVHSHINTMSVFPLFAAKRAGVDVRIAHSHSTAGKGETFRNVLKYALRPFSRVFPTHFFICSDYAGRWLFGDRLIDLGKARLVKYAIDLSRFKFDKQIREAARAELNVVNKFVVMHVGRFMKQKNHLYLIDIFKLVYERNPDSVLLLIGEGELEQEVRDKVERLKLTEGVRFLGVRDDVHRLLMGADVFLLPSLYEGLPVVCVEAQTSGLPMQISSRITREAKLADNVSFLSLDQSAEEWAEEVLACRAGDRETGFHSVAEAGYEIGAAAVDLLESYLRVDAVSNVSIKKKV